MAINSPANLDAEMLHATGASPLHSAQQVRALDRCAIDEHGIAGYALMQRAGAVAFACLQDRWPGARRLVVFCGPGNNGGDGYVMARLALQAGLEVAVISSADPAALKGDAGQAHADWQAAGGVLSRPEQAQALMGSADAVIVDALLGTGIDRSVTGTIAEFIEQINRSSAAVLAVDIPSGLHADHGAVMGVAVKADLTVTFIGRKLGLYTAAGPGYVGQVVFDALKVPQAVLISQPPSALLMTEGLRQHLLPRRRADQHKGDHGHVLVIGGNHGMAGAARLAGEAALRCGAGLVSVATRSAHVAALVSGRPELMVRGVEEGAELKPLLARADVIAVGPGLGQDQWARQLLAGAVDCGKPLIIDADALNLLAEQGAAAPAAEVGDWILTPHPGEAARLLGGSTARIQQDRLACARQIAERFRATVVLKGAGSVVQAAPAADGLPLAWICPAGNPGMGTAGMGDVLTGALASLRAQGLAAAHAAVAATWVHACAGDRAAGDAPRGLLASDLMAHLRSLCNPQGAV